MAAERPIVLVGGGTGGHIYPLVAIAEELQKRGLPFVFIGSKDSREEKVVQEFKWRFYPIASGKWRRYLSWYSFGRNLWDLVRIKIGFWQSVALMFKLKPRVVFCKGGYVALPVILAAWFCRVRIVVHESDSVMGLTNRFASHFADRILTLFEPKIYANNNKRFLQVGIPIRTSLRVATELKIPQKTRPITLILPGSQGSTRINSLVGEVLTELLDLTDLVHMTGESDFKKFSTLRQGLPVKLQARYKVFNFIERELPYYYRSADLIICRASATTLAEASLFKKAVYLIPLPSAAADHQTKNARILEKAQAAKVALEEQLIGEKLLADVKDLLTDQTAKDRMASHLHEYLKEDKSLELIIEQLTK